MNLYEAGLEAAGPLGSGPLGSAPLGSAPLGSAPTVVLGSQRLARPPRRRRPGRLPGRKIIVGIRPEDLSVPASSGSAGSAGSGAARLVGDVRMVEMLGSEQHVYFSLDATPVGGGGESAEEGILVESVPNGVARLDPRPRCGPAPASPSPSTLPACASSTRTQATPSADDPGLARVALDGGDELAPITGPGTGFVAHRPGRWDHDQLCPRWPGAEADCRSYDRVVTGLAIRIVVAARQEQLRKARGRSSPGKGDLAARSDEILRAESAAVDHCRYRAAGRGR